MTANLLQFNVDRFSDRKGGHPSRPAAQITLGIAIMGDSTMERIKLSQNKFALVNDEEFDYLNKVKWNVLKRKNTCYAKRNIRKPNGKQTTILMHREIMQARKGQEIDHRNGNGLDNRRCNLRFCTHAQNIQNSRKLKKLSSKYKGVSFYKQRNTWEAYIGYHKRKIYLGRYDSEIEAAEVYNHKASELFGEFAVLNIIKERV